MAIQNSVALTDLSGRTVPADNVVVSAVHFPKATLNLDDNGVWDGTVTRLITYDLFTYPAVANVQNPDDDYVLGGVKEFPSGWDKEMTPEEYTDLLANGTLAEVWLRDYLQGIIGGVSTIIDPY